MKNTIETFWSWSFCVHMFKFVKEVGTFYYNKGYLVEFCAHLLARLERFIKNE
jgi:hypothetical protein